MLQNLTRKKVLAEQAVLCSSLLSRATGLMFRRPQAMVFAFGSEKVRELHMLFVFFPIDVLFLNARQEVVEIRRLQPFTFCFPREKAQYVVELPAGAAKGTRVGDTIYWQPIKRG